MQKLQVQSPLLDRLTELEKWHSRYEIDTILLQEGYNSADIDAAWQGKGYKQRPNFVSKYRRFLNSLRLIRQLLWRAFPTFLCLILPTLTILGDISLSSTYFWYLVKAEGMNRYEKHALYDATILSPFLLIPVSVSLFIISAVYIGMNEWRSKRYILLLFYHLLPLLVTILLWFALNNLADRYPVRYGA